jgi:methionyl-tRNA formyltransferase
VPTRSDYLDRVWEGLWAKPSFSFIPNLLLPEPAGTAVRGAGPRVAFCGFPSDYSLAFLLALLRLDVEPAAIITSPGAHPSISGENALSQVAGHVGIPLLRPWRVNDEHSRLDLARLELDGVVMASFDQIVGGRALALPRHGWMNIHPSPLPRYRGPEPVYWTIADGAADAGITLHRAVPKFDAGPILAQRIIPVNPGETSGTLTRRLCEAGTQALGEALDALLTDQPGTALVMEQATYRPSVGHRRLDTATGAAEADRMVRAGVPNMPAWTVVDGATVYVTEARVVDDCAGTPLRFDDGCLQLVATAPTCGCHHDQPECPHREG